MDSKLIDIPLGELLEKFGKGSRKPGSGSAAALLAMVSAKMVVTVIDLSKEKSACSKYLPDFLKINELIESNYYPELVGLFQKDSDEFDQVIALRRQRDAEVDPVRKKIIISSHEMAMRKATEIPLRIAELSLDLGKFAIEVFDHGFKAVRGDSGVGVNSAISAVSGCFHIIDLNLTSLSPGEWMEEITGRKADLLKQCKELLREDANRHIVMEKEVEEHIASAFDKAMAIYQKGNLGEGIRNDDDLEVFVRELQNQIWIHKNRIWAVGLPEAHINALQPDTVLKNVLGYKFIEEIELGQHEANGDRFEVAGIIDKSKKLVQILRKFSRESMRFTAAHELGHALLHGQTLLHRDRAVEGSKGTPRDGDERQADKFAALFLMPAKYVREVFEIAFRTSKFEVNESNVIAFGFADLRTFKIQYGETRALAGYLAGSEFFGSKPIVPLHKIFGVSVDAMAIRLIELGLVRV